MSDSREPPWSDNPNAPKIPLWLYLFEKSWFAGNIVGAILYGIRKRSLPTRPPVRTNCFVCLIYSRDAHRVVLQMHGCAV